MRLSERLVFTGLSSAALLLAGYAIVRPGGSAAFATPTFMPAPAASIATFDVYRAADLMMKSERFAPVIMNEQRATELNIKNLEPIEKELLDMQNRLSQFPADTKDPAAKDLAEKFQKQRDDYLAQRQKLTDAFENFTAVKNFEAYNTVVEAAREISTRRGYSHVMATRLVDDGKAPETGLGFTMRILARPVVIGPQADDITAEVLRALRLDAGTGPSIMPGK